MLKMKHHSNMCGKYSHWVLGHKIDGYLPPQFKSVHERRTENTDDRSVNRMCRIPAVSLKMESIVGSSDA